MSRPQIGIDRLPARRMSEQPREAMNCKSCRKRKIKCNRLKPSCEACQIFACACIYDAVPKKRGPKTDVLEALLKRVDGLEKRLKTEGDESANAPVSAVKEAILEAVRSSNAQEEKNNESGRADSATSSPTSGNATTSNKDSNALSPPTSHPKSLANNAYTEVLLDTYFGRIHGKPYYILDETSTRQRLLSNQLPEHLGYAIFAVTARYTSGYGGYEAASRSARDYARRARKELDIDEPSIDSLQTLLLLSQAMFQEGNGKRSYMYLTSAVSMAVALNLHRELPSTLRVSPAEREGRRRLFWSCYLLDRFSACGSKRPSLISDEAIALRLPTGTLQTTVGTGEGEYFPNGDRQYMGGPGPLGSTGMLIGITRILGQTNRYLAAGGVKGDSHFPWHALSNLSKIRQELDLWAQDTQELFSSIEALFGQPDSTVLVLGKLIYHLIHCLIYRPFLPVDLAELSRSSQHQSWQIEATNLCFAHANAIAELVEFGKASAISDWPAFVSYCVCTAGTIHVHGAHYQGRNGEVFSMSGEFLSRELQQLTELNYVWGGIRHQRNTLQTLYSAHSELVKSLATNPIRFSPVFQMEDFFDRYPGYNFDAAHITLNENMSNEDPSGRARAMSAQARLHPGMARAYTDQVIYQLPQATLTLSSSPEPPPRKRRATGPMTGPSPPPNMMSMPAFNGMQSQDAYQSPYGSTSAAQPFPVLQQPLSTSPATGYAHAQSDGSNPILSSDTLHKDKDRTDMHQQQLDPGARFDPMLSMPAQYEHDPNADMGLHGDPSMVMNLNGEQDEADPFLSLLEQLAENEQSRGGPSELDFFLSGAG